MSQREESKNMVILLTGNDAHSQQKPRHVTGKKPCLPSWIVGVAQAVKAGGTATPTQLPHLRANREYVACDVWWGTDVINYLPARVLALGGWSKPFLFA